MGRPAAGSRDRAAAQPEPGVAGSLHPGVEAVADEGAARRPSPDSSRCRSRRSRSAAEAAAAEAEKAAKEKAAAAAPTVARSAALAALLAGQAGAAPALPPGHEIDERYRQLRELVTPPGAAPIDQVLKLLDDLRQQLARMNAAGVGAPAVAAGRRSFACAASGVPAPAAAAGSLAGQHGRAEHGVARRRRAPAGCRRL